MHNDDMESRVLKVLIVKRGAPIFDESGFEIELVDDGAGEFVTVAANMDGDAVSINPEEWFDLRAAIDEMVGCCRGVPPE